MEDVKWLFRRCGLPILLLLIFVIAGVFYWGKLHAEKQKVAEEVWEQPVEIENSEAETEEAENTESCCFAAGRLRLSKYNQRSDESEDKYTVSKVQQ